MDSCLLGKGQDLAGNKGWQGAVDGARNGGEEGGW